MGVKSIHSIPIVNTDILQRIEVLPGSVFLNLVELHNRTYLIFEWSLEIYAKTITPSPDISHDILPVARYVQWFKNSSIPDDAIYLGSIATDTREILHLYEVKEKD